jgi:hypothetical protein
MNPNKANVQEDLERWENEGGSTPARKLSDERHTDLNMDRRHVQQPRKSLIQGRLWGMCSRLLEGVGGIFGIQRHRAR